MRSLVLLFLIPLLANAGQSDLPGSSCEGFLEAVKGGKISKYFLLQVKTEKEAYALLSEFGLLDTQEFNESVKLSLKKEGVDSDLVKKGQLYEYAEKLSKIILRWDVKETRFVFSVLDSYLEILKSKVPTRTNLFLLSKAESLVADIKTSQHGRFAFTNAVRETLVQTLVHATVDFSDQYQTPKNTLPLLSPMRMDVHSMAFLRLDPPQQRLRSVLKPSEISGTQKSVLKNRINATRDLLSLQSLLSKIDVKTLSPVDIAYSDQLELVDLWIESYAIGNLVNRSNLDRSQLTQAETRNNALLKKIHDLRDQIWKKRIELGSFRTDSKAVEVKVEMVKIMLDVVEFELTSITKRILDTKDLLWVL